MKLKPLLLRSSVACALALAACGALAQAGESADTLIRAGLDGLEKIDQGRSGELWEAAPPFVKAKLTKAAFVESMQTSRQSLPGLEFQGALRDWSGVTRVRYADDGAGMPAGLYANVDFATHLRNGTLLFEKVSFRSEQDGWRLVGYTLRNKQ